MDVFIAILICPRLLADLRYDNWLKQLLDARQVYGLYWQGVLAGFIGHSGNNLVLHALAEKYRGKGLVEILVERGVWRTAGNWASRSESSISAANLAAFNLYASLGFTFSHPQDVYHRMTTRANFQ